MFLKDFYHEAHHLVEASERRRISHEEMAGRLGASTRAYAEWLKGGREPLAASGIIRMLSMLGDEEMLKIVRQFVAEKNKNEKDD